VANLVAESDLLAGLVPAEMFASAPAAALQAQAVAARGQLLGKIGTRHLDDPFLLCAEQHCQVYAGASREDARATSAVRKTRGQVLLRADGARLVDTVYSANSGGHTEDNDLVWPSPADPQLRGRPDPLVARSYPTIDGSNMERWLREAPRTYSSPESPQSSSYRWTATVDLTALAQHPLLPPAIGTVRGFQVMERGRSGRALRLRIQAERGEADLVGELVIRRALGDLRSAAFVVLPEPDAKGRVQLLGAGHGHGVGMCQHGAMGMGRAGLDCEQILAHYYPGGKLRSLW
jgi:SpoIID/LytB domain protein